MTGTYTADYSISIHAPARGATVCVNTIFGACAQFQSTLPRGERLSRIRFLQYAPFYFNPRSREGSDDGSVFSGKPGSKNFNPRSREGSDGNGIKIEVNGSDFNPRSREGSDYSTGGPTLCSSAISIHAPARGATQSPSRSSKNDRFQSTLPRGERLVFLWRPLPDWKFQSTLPRGERPSTSSSTSSS